MNDLIITIPAASAQLLSETQRQRLLRAVELEFANQTNLRPIGFTASSGTLQQRVAPWMLQCFGPEISADVRERCHRFFEEAGELCQSCGMTKKDALTLVDYTWGRPVGVAGQEVGGSMITLAALCLALGVDMDVEAQRELARIWTCIDRIRDKRASKRRLFPDNPATPLPGE